MIFPADFLAQYWKKQTQQNKLATQNQSDLN